MDAVLELRPNPDELGAAAQEHTAGPRLRVGDPDRREAVYAREFRKLVRIARIGLRPRLPDALHLVRVRHQHRVSERCQVRLEPGPVQRRLHRHRDRPRQLREPPGQLAKFWPQPSAFRDHPPVVRERASRDVALVQIQPDRRHGVPPVHVAIPRKRAPLALHSARRTFIWSGYTAPVSRCLRRRHRGLGGLTSLPAPEGKRDSRKDE